MDVDFLFQLIAANQGGGGDGTFTLTAAVNPVSSNVVGYDDRPSGQFGTISQEPFSNLELSIVLSIASSGSLAIRFKGNVVSELSGVTVFERDGVSYSLGSWSYRSSSDETEVSVSASPFVDGQAYACELR